MQWFHARLLVGVSLVASVACAPTTLSDDVSDASDVSDDSEPSSLAVACTSVVGGAWSASGECFGMEMGTTIEVVGCTVTFSDWSMQMSVPAGAEVDGTDVSLTGTGWDDCDGTLSSDGASINGSCSDGCAFVLELALDS